ncbi:hypothetical protein [Streptomyces sp. NPDC056683]|uniref:hypothetical protein n=1 Tax=Streptomyces sp. NPDC056683 TaxID=3345910 RepID=UPI0036A00514
MAAGHILGIPVGKEVAGLLVVDVDVEVAVQSPRIALLGQMPIEQGDGLLSRTCGKHEDGSHGLARRQFSFVATMDFSDGAGPSM